MVIDPLPAAVGEPLLGGGGQLRGGDPVAPVQVDHRAGQGGMGADHLGDLGRVDVDVQVAVHRHLAQLGDQAGVVLGAKKVASTPNTSVIRSSTATVNGRTSCSIWLR